VPLTKLDLARYYEAVARWMLPHVIGRPLTLVHCPKGVPPAGARKGIECVYMRHAKVWGPSALRRVRIREKTKVGEYLVVENVAGLVALAQMDVLEIHTWNSRIDHLEQPDRIVLDLDPGRDVPWSAVIDAAKQARDLLALLGLVSAAKTTGGRGIHIVVPLRPQASWSACLDFARTCAGMLTRRQPERFTNRFAKGVRDDKILIDYLRNNRTNTSIAAFSTRARPHAPVSTPLAWQELRASQPPERFTLRAVVNRLAHRRGDAWRAYWSAAQALAPDAARALEEV